MFYLAKQLEGKVVLPLEEILYSSVTLTLAQLLAILSMGEEMAEGRNVEGWRVLLEERGLFVSATEIEQAMRGNATIDWRHSVVLEHVDDSHPICAPLKSLKALLVPAESGLAVPYECSFACQGAPDQQLRALSIQSGGYRDPDADPDWVGDLQTLRALVMNGALVENAVPLVFMIKRNMLTIRLADMTEMAEMAREIQYSTESQSA